MASTIRYAIQQSGRVAQNHRFLPVVYVGGPQMNRNCSQRTVHGCSVIIPCAGVSYALVRDQC